MLAELQTNNCLTVVIVDVEWSNGVSMSPVYQVFDKTLKALNEMLKTVRLPTPEVECKAPDLKFREWQKMPLHGIIAAIDGIYFDCEPIQKSGGR